MIIKEMTTKRQDPSQELFKRTFDEIASNALYGTTSCNTTLPPVTLESLKEISRQCEDSYTLESGGQNDHINQAIRQ